MKNKIVTLLIMLVGISNIYANVNADISGFARTYEGAKFDNGDFTIIQQTLNLNYELKGERSAFKANPMLYLNGTNNITLRLRELYADLYFNSVDVRLGKQQIVWGKADGVFITDVVSPLNLTEFLLPDFDEIRTGIVAVKTDFYLGNSTVEAIVVPLFTPTTKPDSNSIWSVTPNFPTKPTFDMSKANVTPALDNSEFFLKYSLSTSAIDIELMGGYAWDDNPALHIKKEIDKTTTPPSPKLTITPEYHRLTLTGGSFSTQIKSIVLRGEGAYYFDKKFNTTDPKATDGLVDKDYVNYVLGIDFSIKSVKLSGQFIQKFILDHNDYMSEDRFENTATALVHYDMLRETLHLDLFSYIGINDGDALIRPKATYDFDDGFSIVLGANIFAGDEDGQFGQYSDNSMIYTKIKYSF